MNLQKYITAAKAMQSEKPYSFDWIAASDVLDELHGEKLAALLLEADALLPKWLPVESAPRDGTWFLAISKEWDNAKSPLMIRYLKGPQWSGFVDWDDDSYDHITYWMPLPGAPK